MRRIVSTWGSSRAVAVNAGMHSAPTCSATTTSARYHQTSVYTVTLSFVEECVRAEQWEAAQSSLQPVLEGMKDDNSTTTHTSPSHTSIKQEMVGPLSALLETSIAGNSSGSDAARDAFVTQLEAMLDSCRSTTTATSNTASTSTTSTSSSSSPAGNGITTNSSSSKGSLMGDDADDDDIHVNSKNLRLYENEDEDGSDPGKPRRQHHHHQNNNNQRHGGGRGGYQNRGGGGGGSSTHLKSPFALDSALGWKEQQIGHGWKNPSKTKNHGNNNNNNKGGNHKREFKQRPRQTEAGAVLSETLHLNRQLTEILRNLQEIQASQELVDAKRHAEQRRRFPGQPNLRKFTKVNPVIQERMRSLVASSWSRAFTLVSDQLCASRVRQQISATHTTGLLVAGMLPPTGLLMHPVHTSTFSLLMGILSTFPGEAATKTAGHECIADYYKSKFNHNGAEKEAGGGGGDGSKVDFDEGHRFDDNNHHRNKNKDLTSIPPPDPYDPNSPTLTAERRCMLVLEEYSNILAHQRRDKEFIELLREARESESKDAIRALISTPPPPSTVAEESNTTANTAHIATTPPRIASVFPSVHMQLYQRREELLSDISSDYNDGVDEIIKTTISFQGSNSLEPSMSLMKATADASKKIGSTRMAMAVLFSPSFKPAKLALSSPPSDGEGGVDKEKEMNDIPTTSTNSSESHRSTTTTMTTTPTTPASAMITPSTAIGAIVALTKRRQWESAIAFIEEMRHQQTHATDPAIRAGAVGVLTHLNLASHVAACVADGAVYCRRGAGLYLFNRGLLPRYPNPHGATLYARAQIDSLKDDGGDEGVSNTSVTTTTTLNPSSPLPPTSSIDDDDEAFLVEFEKSPSDGNNNNPNVNNGGGSGNNPGTWRSNTIKEMRKDPYALPPNHFDDSSFSHWEYALGVVGGASASVSPGLGVVYGLRALRTMGLWEKAIWVLQTYSHHLDPPSSASDSPLNGVMGLSSSPMYNQHKMAASAVMLRENSRTWIPPQGINAAEKLLRDPLMTNF